MSYHKDIQNLVNSYGHWFNDEEWMKKGAISGELKPHKALFKPIQVNHLKIKNRIVMGPMGNINMADETGKPSEQMIAYFIERAKGGVGLITSGMVPVSMDDDPTYGDKKGTSIFPRMDTHRSNYAGWRSIAEGCHAYGARFFVQLAPGMGRVGNPECLIKKGKLPISSSWQKNWYMPQIPCRPISDRSIKKLINKTAQMAADCKALCIDGVYLHGHSGYFIEQMTDSAYNKRKLGRYKDIKAFGIDLVKKIRERVGKHYPIYYRINISAAFRATFEEKMDQEKYLKRLRNERSVQETLDYMIALVHAGVDMFDVDLGGYENWWLPHPPNAMPPGAYLKIASFVKTYFDEKQVLTNKGLNVPIVAVGKLGNPDLAESALRKEQCDMVMLSRPLLADPEWPKKVYAGHIDDIRPCIGDHEGCLAQLASGGHPHCAVNPRTAFEYRYPKVSYAKEKKNIAIVGAGPAGTMAALTLFDRGHDVTLYDKNSQAGGMLLYGGVPKVKYEIKNYVKYINHELNKRSIKKNYNHVVNVPLLASKGYDIIILSTGTKPLIPKVPGYDLPHVISGVDFLSECNKFKDKEHFVVVGGSDVGCEIAHIISYEWQKPVSIVEMTPYFMKKTCTSNRNYMIHHLDKNHVKLMNCTRLESIDMSQVTVIQNQSKSVPDPTISWLPILPENVLNPFEKEIKEELIQVNLDADVVIMATGAQPNDQLYEALIKEDMNAQIMQIGDAFEPGRVLEAVKAGYQIGITI